MYIKMHRKYVNVIYFSTAIIKCPVNFLFHLFEFIHKFKTLYQQQSRVPLLVWELCKIAKREFFPMKFEGRQTRASTRKPIFFVLRTSDIKITRRSDPWKRSTVSIIISSIPLSRTLLRNSQTWKFDGLSS